MAVHLNFFNGRLQIGAIGTIHSKEGDSMTEGQIDWGIHLQQGLQDHAARGTDTEELQIFTDRVAGEVGHLYFPQEMVARAESAGLHVAGVRYFQALFAEPKPVHPQLAVTSAFTGAVAHALPEIAGEAYGLLAGRYTNQDILHADLRLQLGTAAREERTFKGSVSRHDRLTAVAKELGQPWQSRVAGRLSMYLALTTEQVYAD
jgi:hypothetical protein